MIILNTNTDHLKATLSAARNVDVHVSFMDMTNADPPAMKGSTSGRTNTALTNTTRTTIVDGAASTVRAVDKINIRNKDVNPVDVLIDFDQNATVFELIKMTLNAGDTLVYEKGLGWFLVRNSQKLDTKLRVSGDVANATTSFADITGLTCPVEAGKQYGFLAYLYHIENAATTGARFGINGPAMTGMRINGVAVYTGSLTAAVMQAPLTDVTALDTSVMGTTTASTATPQVALFVMTGWFNPSAAGIFAVRSQSEVAVAAGVTVKSGSWCRVWEFDN